MNTKEDKPTVTVQKQPNLFGQFLMLFIFVLLYWAMGAIHDYYNAQHNAPAIEAIKRVNDEFAERSAEK